LKTRKTCGGVFFAEPFLVSVVEKQGTSRACQPNIGSEFGIIISLLRTRKDTLEKIADLGQALFTVKTNSYIIFSISF